MEDIGDLKNVHKHPLILYQYGKPNANEKGICSICRKQWRPPAFRCYGCDFHVHQSCIKLPPEIRSPIHHHHKSPLVRLRSNTYCKCCGQKPIGDTYNCPECDFVMDLQCVIADTKASGLSQVEDGEFRHFAHPHPLTFQQHQQCGNRIVVCLVCNLRIKSDSSTYVCTVSDCDSHFHQQCAELSREVRDLRYHQHPLFLFARSFDKDNLCNSCRNHCFKFFYSCPPCKFNLHVSCLSSFQHQHEFIQLHKLFPYTCQICGKKTSERTNPWFCSICHLFAHKNCAELPTILHTFEHHHPLNLTFPHGDHQDICKICREKINLSFARYACRSCSYHAHLSCAKIRQKCDQDEEQDGIDKVNIRSVTLPFIGHKHKLTLCPGEDNKHCNACMQCIVTESYGCPPCGFYLHEECAGLQRQRIISPLHLHELNMVYVPDFLFSCSVCDQYCHGFAYHCKKCHYAIDVRCAAITFPFIHSSHNHPLFPFDDKVKHKCGGCGEGLMNKLVFGCDDCNFYLDARCANLPLAVRNRFDEHPLSLTFENNKDEQELGEEHYCNICEQERASNEWFYYCEMCYFAAHLSCALGDYPFVKSAKFEGHRHPLNLVTEGKKGYSACGACGHSCESNLAFECGHSTCKFNVHAFGLCYHKQLTQGRITFAMPSLYSRSLALYLDPIERKRSKSILLGGNRQAWKERDFSGIREFMVNHERWVHSIEIQYEEKHDGDGHCTSKGLEEEIEYDVERNNNVAMSMRQYGGLEGKNWDDGAAFSSIIQKVEITHEKSINSIRTTYDHNGILDWSQNRGGNRGAITSTVNLEYPNEYLISIRGYIGSYGKNYVIRSLTLESNKKMYGPFGTEEGRRFCFPTSGAKIVGFHGRSGNYLTSIGIKVVPISQPQNHCFGVINFSD